MNAKLGMYPERSCLEFSLPRILGREKVDSWKGKYLDRLRLINSLISYPLQELLCLLLDRINSCNLREINLLDNSVRC